MKGHDKSNAYHSANRTFFEITHRRSIGEMNTDRHFIVQGRPEHSEYDCVSDIQAFNRALISVNNLMAKDKLKYAGLIYADFECFDVGYIDGAPSLERGALTPTLQMLDALQSALEDASSLCEQHAAKMPCCEDAMMRKVQSIALSGPIPPPKGAFQISPALRQKYFWLAAKVETAMEFVENGNLWCGGIVWSDGHKYFGEVYMSDKGACPTCVFQSGMNLLAYAGFHRVPYSAQ